MVERELKKTYSIEHIRIEGKEKEKKCVILYDNLEQQPIFGETNKGEMKLGIKENIKREKQRGKQLMEKAENL